MTSAASGVEPVIRRGTVADAAALAAFGTRVFRDAFGAHNTPENLSAYLETAFSDDIQREELGDPAVDTWLVIADGMLAGYAQLRAGAAPASVPQERSIELRRFYIDRRWQGRGLAQQLMQRVDAAASLRGAQAIWLGVWELNPRAIAFYRTCGFIDVGSQVFVLGAERQTDRVMCRELADSQRRG